MYNDVRDHGRIMKGPNDKRDKSLSESYTKSLYRMFHMCLQRAVKERLILCNPCDDVVLPKVEKKEITILKPEDMIPIIPAHLSRLLLSGFIRISLGSKARGTLAYTFRYTEKSGSIRCTLFLKQEGAQNAMMFSNAIRSLI